MGMGEMLGKELTSWGVLAIVIVILLIVLGQIDTVGKAVNTDATTNATTQTFISGFITGLSEPKNWVAIFVIAIIGFGIVMYIRKKKT